MIRISILLLALFHQHYFYSILPKNWSIRAKYERKIDVPDPKPPKFPDI